MLSYEQMKEMLDESYLDLSKIELKERYNIFVCDCETAWCDGVPAILLTLTSRWSEDILTQLTKNVRDELSEKGLMPYRVYSLNNRRRFLILVDDANARKELSTDELKKRQSPLLIPKRKWREGSIPAPVVDRATIEKAPTHRRINPELKHR